MPLNIALIRASFDEVKPIANEVVTHFYKTLFENYPAAKALFAKTDFEKQKSALISSLVMIVDNIDNADKLTPYLRKMGARHVRYGVQEEHYGMVGKSLIATFRHFFGSNWSAALEEQWVLAIGVVADQMLEGAKVHDLSAQGQHKPEPQDLSQMVRQLARNLLYKMLEQEADAEFTRIARKKAASILTQALREEAEQIQEQFTQKKKAS